eukprot:Hpha_TRINITY_DN10119_c0_g2::TRINITY_DN10119_c0_g2_i1::g.131743::m.131743
MLAALLPWVSSPEGVSLSVTASCIVGLGKASKGEEGRRFLGALATNLRGSNSVDAHHLTVALSSLRDNTRTSEVSCLVAALCTLQEKNPATKVGGKEVQRALKAVSRKASRGEEERVVGVVLELLKACNKLGFATVAMSLYGSAAIRDSHQREDVVAAIAKKASPEGTCELRNVAAGMYGLRNASLTTSSR